MVWLIYWGTFWGDDAFSKAWDSGLHTFIIIMSIINFILKLVIIGIIVIFDADVKNNLLPNGLVKNLKDVANVFTGG